MSELAESSYAESCASDFDETYFVQDETIFDKPRGQRRWLGKHHHRGKERLHESVKDRTFIEKIVTSTVPISTKVAERIENASKDDLKLKVVYSMDKKNRWNDATTITLLGGAPENLNAEVVERNALERYGLLHPNKSTFAVHSRKQIEEDGEFEIRSAKSSGKGQDYSNFLPKSREFSKKANARKLNVREESNENENEPTITYNIYRTHQSQDVVGSQLFKATTVSKSGRHRANKKIDMEVYEDDEDFYDEEDDFDDDAFSTYRARNSLNLTDFMVSNEKKQPIHHKNRKDSELSYEMMDFYPEYTEQFNVQEYLHKEGYTFMESDVTFSNQKECFEDQINQLRQEKDLIIKDLRPNQYLIDISKRCQMGGIGETNTVMVFTHLKEKTFNVIVNSTITSHPEKRTGEFLRSLISSSATILEAVTRVAGEMFQNLISIQMISLSAKCYGEKDIVGLLNDADTWDSQLKNVQKMLWPNQHYHATWANSEELSQIGGKIEWNDLCDMVKKENRMRTCYTFEDRCGSCNQKKKSHQLFFVENESRVKCTECLKNEFFREFIAKRLPTDLQTDTADELEYLPTFIPLTLLNLYIRMMAETIYKDFGATGEFEKCASCKSSLFFEEKEKTIQNRSCPCGYSWCSTCKNVPHWPMNCEDYSEWEKKWLLRYSMMHAQGSGNGTLVQISCSCAQSIFSILLPTDQFVSCPKCKTTVNTKTMHAICQLDYWPFSPRSRERLRRHYAFHKNKDSHQYQPLAEIRTDVSKIPAIKESVMEVCGAARDERFNINSRNQMIKREHYLNRKGILIEESIENMLGTSAYLVENVTAWMNQINYHNRIVKSTLENMMENRKNLMESMGGEDKEIIGKLMKKLRNDIDLVVSEVEKKIQNDNFY